jgi:2-isopropylmalate synthase
MVGLSQKIEVGFMSGKSNVIYCLEARGIPPEDALVEKILDAAKRSDTILSDETIDAIVAGYRTVSQ